MRSSGAAVVWVLHEVAADRQLALRRGPQDGVHLALDDAARIHLHEDFRLVARLHVTQFVLVKEGQQPGIILVDEAHHRPGRKLRGAHAGTQREIRHAAVGRREMRRAVEVVFRTQEVLFGLGNLRFGLRFRGVGREKFAFQISEIALRLLEVGPSPGTRIRERGELFDALFRQVDPRSQRGLLGRRVIELILPLRPAWPRRLSRPPRRAPGRP